MALHWRYKRRFCIEEKVRKWRWSRWHDTRLKLNWSWRYWWSWRSWRCPGSRIQPTNRGRGYSMQTDADAAASLGTPALPPPRPRASPLGRGRSRGRRTGSIAPRPYFRPLREMVETGGPDLAIRKAPRFRVCAAIQRLIWPAVAPRPNCWLVQSPLFHHTNLLGVGHSIGVSLARVWATGIGAGEL